MQPSTFPRARARSSLAAAMVASRFALLATTLVATAGAVEQRVAAAQAANPIRKVVTMLQKMQVKVEQEGEKEEELYEKFSCYCKTSGGDLSGGIEAANTKIPQLEAEMKAAEDQKKQVDEALAQAKTDRADAKAAMEAATAQREKEATEFDTLKTEYTANIAAMTKATAALEKGAAGSFLQTDAANSLRKFIDSGKQDMPDYDRELIISFLSGNPFSQGYASQSGEIIGILKQMNDEMAKSLAEATSAEEKSISIYEELMAAKTKEVNALTKMTEEKIKKSGELAVSIAQMGNDLEDTSEGLAEDKAFLAELEKSCDSKAAEWDERVKTRKGELLALADTIKILNDDDALELFKKTLPGASASFVQMSVSSAVMRSRAMAVLAHAAEKTGRPNGTLLKFIEFALRGKKIGLEKVITMIDNMVATLKTEQEDDNAKKEYCNKELDVADDKKKVLEKTISDTEASIAAAKEGIATTTEEIATLIAGIKALDKSVAEATEQRKEENADYKELMANDSAAKEILKLAMNRLNKFYNPKLYQPPAKKERSSMDAIAEDVGGAAALVQVSLHDQQKDEKDAPPPPPETFGAYTKKSEETGGVIEMVNLLMTDLEKEMAEAETAEKDSQADYEALMKDSAEKRTKDSQALSDKEGAKAELEDDLQANKETLKGATKDLSATLKYIHSLHTECDWLLKYFDVRQEMRASEIDALGKAKAVLSGADFSLL